MINYEKSPVSNLCKYVFVLTLVVATYLVINPVNAQSSQEQVTEKGVLDTQELKAFEGYYQFQNDKDVFLQITAKGNNFIELGA